MYTYAPPPSPQIENLSQAKTAVIPFVPHVASPSRPLVVKLGLGAVALVGLVLLAAVVRSRR